MGKYKPSIESLRAELEAEYLEPLPDIITGYMEQGNTRRDTAAALECSFLSFRKFCAAENIHFPSVNARRRRGSYFAEETENRRWRNMTRTHRKKARQIVFAGESMCLSEWAERAGIPRTTLKTRLARGVSFPEAITQTNPDARRIR